MNDEPRQKLCELIVEYGRSLCNDPRRCEGLLKDYCGNHKREIFVLVSALKKKVTDDLLKPSAGVPQEMVMGRLQKRLEDELALTDEAAHWAVESWALALGFITVPQPMVKTATRAKPLPVGPKTVPLVSPPQINQVLMADRYRDNSDGTVTDVTTGLQWMRFALGQEWKGGTCVGQAKTYTWNDAMKAAVELNHKGGYSGRGDWRLPTKDELLSLVYCSSGIPKTWNDTGRPCEGNFDKPTIHQQAFPNTPSSGFWSASAYAGNSSSAWYVYFGYGYADYYFYKSYAFQVRLVRAGQ